MKRTALRVLRESRGLTLMQLSTQIHSDQGHLSRIERGKSFPSPRLARKLAAYYDCTLDAVYGRMDPES